MNDIKDAYTLIQTIVDTQENLVLVIEDQRPILINKAFMNFFGVSSFDQYNKDFGNFINNFVPHPSYFHAGKVEDAQTWVQALNALEDEDKIVSMLSTSHEPRAFSVKLDDSHANYTVLSLEDISANLIKRIMIENDMNMDKSSGAYTKDYFLHTAEILQDGAAYNEKDIGLSLLHIYDATEEELRSAVVKIKSIIRQNDILVKWAGDMLLLAYLVDLKENAVLFTTKVHSIMPSGTSSAVVSLVETGEKVPNVINKMRTSLDELNKNEMKVL